MRERSSTVCSSITAHNRRGLKAKYRTFTALLLLGTMLGGCKRREQESTNEAHQPLPPPAKVAEPTVVPPTVDLLSLLPRCEIKHLGGELIDLGGPAAEGREAWRFINNPDNANIEKEGATWARYQSRSVSYLFHWDQDTPIVVRARARGLAAKSATIFIDGKALGTVGLAKGQAKLVAAGPSNNPLPQGIHTVTIRFPGTSKVAAEPLAEIDWLHIGPPIDEVKGFAAPTLKNVQQDVALGGTPHRSLSLRADSVVRCPLGVAPGSKLRVSLGMQGPGEGETEIRIRRDAQPTTLLRATKVAGGERSEWLDIDVPLSNFAGELVWLELAVTQSTKGSRVLFGDPMVITPNRTNTPVPPARAVIVAVVSGIDPTRLPPWDLDRPLPTFDVLSKEGVVFERHRSPSSVTQSVVASLFTGVSPREHGLEDPYARLAPSLPTLATLCRDASVHTTFLTANPCSFEAFGFNKNWDKFASYSPISPTFGTAPLDEFSSWLSEQAKSPTGLPTRLFAIVHSRGIHPPFDQTPSEAALLAPPEYSGAIDPRRAGQTLEKLRRKRALVKLTDADRVRLRSLIDTSLAQTDRALSNLIDTLRKTRIWNDTLFVVTSDVASASDPNGIPFAEVPEPVESALRGALYVHFPSGAYAGKRSSSPTTTIDITRTVLAALNIPPHKDMGGMDLHSLVSQAITPIERPLEATLADKGFARWGDLRMVTGKEGSAPRMCNVATDAACETDLRDSLPMTALVLWRWAYHHEQLGRKPNAPRPAREPATIDQETAAALAVWGK